MLPMHTGFPRRFRLARLMVFVSLCCVWMGFYRVDVELFVGVGILAVLVTGVVIRLRYPARGVIAFNELLAAAFFLCIGWGLVIRYLCS